MTVAGWSWEPKHSGISTQRLELGKEGSSFQSKQGQPGSVQGGLCFQVILTVFERDGSPPTA